MSGISFILILLIFFYFSGSFPRCKDVLKAMNSTEPGRHALDKNYIFSSNRRLVCYACGKVESQFWKKPGGISRYKCLPCQKKVSNYYTRRMKLSNLIYDDTSD